MKNDNFWKILRDRFENSVILSLRGAILSPVMLRASRLRRLEATVFQKYNGGRVDELPINSIRFVILVVCRLTPHTDCELRCLSRVYGIAQRIVKYNFRIEYTCFISCMKNSSRNHRLLTHSVITLTAAVYILPCRDGFGLIIPFSAPPHITSRWDTFSVQLLLSLCLHAFFLLQSFKFFWRQILLLLLGSVANPPLKLVSSPPSKKIPG